MKTATPISGRALRVVSAVGTCRHGIYPLGTKFARDLWARVTDVEDASLVGARSTGGISNQEASFQYYLDYLD